MLDKEVDSLRSTNIQLPPLPQNTGKDTGFAAIGLLRSGHYTW